jgi:MFS family permease
LLGGFLTNSFDWHWNFLINVPIGILVVVLGRRLLPPNKVSKEARHLDVAGAVTVTLALLLAVYAIVNGNTAGWLSIQTVGLLVAAFGLLGLFIWIESRVKSPIMPLSLFKIRNLTVANGIGVLWAASMFAWFFLSALYLQLVLHYSPLQVGLVFLPSNLIMAAFSLGLSAKLVMRFGIKKPLSVGLGIAALGLLLFVRAPVNGNVWLDVLPSMLLLGLGAGMAFNPVFLAAMNDVPPDESGLASGVVNTSFMMGGALGLSILASIAASRTLAMLASGVPQLEALTNGYHAAFLVGAIFAALAAVLGWTQLKVKEGGFAPETLH